jgi:hypothetical protein
MLVEAVLDRDLSAAVPCSVKAVAAQVKALLGVLAGWPMPHHGGHDGHHKPMHGAPVELERRAYLVTRLVAREAVYGIRTDVRHEVSCSACSPMQPCLQVRLHYLVVLDRLDCDSNFSATGVCFDRWSQSGPTVGGSRWRWQQLQ